MAGHYQVNPVFPVPVSNLFSSSLGRQRHFYTETQLELLDAEFAAEQFPSRERRRSIAQQLNVTEKSVLWWFQNRRRRVRQQTKSLNSGSNNHRVGRSRQCHRSSPYASSQTQRQQGENWTPVSTGWPVWPSSHPFPATNDPQTPEEQTESSSVESTSPSYQQDSSRSPVDDQAYQSHWMSPSSSVNNQNIEMQPHQFYNYSYPSGFQVEQVNEQHNSYWNNWEYSPPFYPSTMPNNWSTNSPVYPCPVETSDYSNLYYY